MKRLIALVCLLAMMTVMLVSCGVNFENMEKKLEDKGYTVMCFTEKNMEEAAEYLGGDLDDAKIKNFLIAFKLDGFLGGESKGVSVVEFTDVEDAKEYAEEMGDEAVRSGKVVYVGDEESIKIVK